MGELQKDIAGQNALNDWYQQRNNEATLKGSSDRISPSQEMLNFQRRLRTRQIDFIVTVGQFLVVRAVVPRGESWKIHYWQCQHNDSVPVRVLLQFIPGQRSFAGPVPFVLTRRDVEIGTVTPLIVAAGPEPATSFLFNRIGGPLPELLPGDELQFVTGVMTSAAPDWEVLFRYEVIPPPALSEVDSLFSASSI